MYTCTKALRAAILAAVLLGATSNLNADMLTFNSDTPTENAAIRAEWLAAAGMSEPLNRVDFEDLEDGQNIHGLALFPMGLVIRDTDAAIALITSGPIGGSNPVGLLALSQNEQPFLELDFSAQPVDYVAFQDIDTQATVCRVTFVGGETDSMTIETTAGSGDSAEFLGIFRNEMPRIVKVELNASGDGLWAIDNLEYGTLPIPSCDEDVTGDGTVNVADLVAVILAWGECPDG